MSQDKEAIIVLSLGILFGLIIVTASYSNDHSKIPLVALWTDGGASVLYGFTLVDREVKQG
jgi:hypothetical protein